MFIRPGCSKPGFAISYLLNRSPQSVETVSKPTSLATLPEVLHGWKPLWEENESISRLAKESNLRDALLRETALFSEALVNDPTAVVESSLSC